MGIFWILFEILENKYTLVSFMISNFLHELLARIMYHNKRFRDKECHDCEHNLSEAAKVIRVNQIIQYLPLKKLLCKKQLTLEKHLADITLSLKALLLSGIIMILTSPTLPS